MLASLVELVVVWGWHAPARGCGRELDPRHVVEQATFLAAGLLLWLCLHRPQGQRRPATRPAPSALLLTSIHMTLLGALLALAPRPLYGAAT